MMKDPYNIGDRIRIIRTNETGIIVELYNTYILVKMDKDNYEIYVIRNTIELAGEEEATILGIEKEMR